MPSIWDRFQVHYYNANNNYITSHEEERKKWSKFIDMVLDEFGFKVDHDNLFNDLYDEYAKGNSRKLCGGIEKLLEFLKTNNLVLGVLSNNDERLINVIDELGIKNYFNHIIPCSTIGYKKPSQECFNFVEKKIKINPDSIVYIGDDFEVDYIPAANAGWNAIHFDHDSLKDTNKEILSVNSHNELLRLFESYFSTRD